MSRKVQKPPVFGFEPSGLEDHHAAGERDRTEIVYREIHAAIVGRRLPPGARLPEAHLAEIFGVSRTLVRQALQRLVHDHLAVQEPNRSVRIAAPSIEEVRHVYEVRRLMECAMIEKSAPPLSRVRLAALRRLVSLEAEANAAGDTRTAMQLADAFHVELATAMSNPVLVDMLRELIARGNVAIALYEVAGRAKCRCQEHRRILTCLAGGHRGEAAAEMATHLTAIETGLMPVRSGGARVDLGEIFQSGGKLRALKDRSR